jgi:NAD(P)H-dependent FMN reductase
MKKILAFGGSNSKNSINKTFAVHAANRIKNAEVIIADLNDFDIPMYGIDNETENGIPVDVQRLNVLLQSTDGLVISLAEHNGSYATAFKNAFDWLSRIDQNVWKNKPMLLMATSPGGRGGAGVLQTAKSSFPHLGGNIVADFSLPSFNANFSENGLNDEDLDADLKEKVLILEQSI